MISSLSGGEIVYRFFKPLPFNSSHLSARSKSTYSSEERKKKEKKKKVARIGALQYRNKDEDSRKVRVRLVG